MSEQSKCPVCLSTSESRVKFDPCAHEVCRRCANELVQRQTTQCPECREHINTYIFSDYFIHTSKQRGRVVRNELYSDEED